MSELDAELDAKLDAKLDGGDLRGAATLALRGYGPQLVGYLRAISPSDSDAQEAFAQLAEDMWKGLPGFRRECPLRCWLYKLALNGARRQAADRFHRRGRRLQTSELSHLAGAVYSTVATAEKAQVKTSVQRLRARLSADENTLLILRIDRGMTWAEVGHILARRGRPLDEPALRKRFERLKEKLKELAKAEGLTRS